MKTLFSTVRFPAHRQHPSPPVVSPGLADPRARSRGRAARIAGAAFVPLALAFVATPTTAQHSDTLAVGPTSGFEAPVALIPEIGLWADGLAELGFTQTTGLVIWWDRVQPEADAVPAAAGLPVDWSRVTYRIRAEVYDADGKRVGREQKLVEPYRADAFAERGGFPVPMHVTLPPGRYRVRLEGYPLISAAAAGLDSVPRGVAEVEAVIPDATSRNSEWRLSDLLFLRSLERWEAGASDERTWYEWVVDPSVPRVFGGDSALAQAYVAFEVLRGEEFVPRCQGRNTCRIVVSIFDGEGDIVHQELRAVPNPRSVSAYVVPLEIAEWPPGEYSAEVEIYEGRLLLGSISRTFRVRGEAG